MNDKQLKKSQLYSGVVVSDKMDKTIVVNTSRTYKHPRVQKVLRRNKKYKVHDEQGTAKLGDIVEFYEGRPVSKDKYMYIARIVKPHS